MVKFVYFIHVLLNGPPPPKQAKILNCVCNKCMMKVCLHPVFPMLFLGVFFLSIKLEYYRGICSVLMPKLDTSVFL